MSNISRHYEKSSPLPAGYEGSSPQKWYTDSGAALLSCVWVDLCGDFRIMEERRELQPSTKHRSLYHDDHWHREPPESAELRLMSKNTEKWSHHHHYNHQQASTPSKETKRQFRWTMSKYWWVITTPILSWAVLAQLRMRIKKNLCHFLCHLVRSPLKTLQNSISIWLLTCDFCPQNLSLGHLFFSDPCKFPNAFESLINIWDLKVSFNFSDHYLEY